MKKFLFLLLIIPLISFGQSVSEQRQLLISKSFESDEFEMYIDKFYRDLRAYGIYPVRPKNIIVKFSYFDRIKSQTHVHGSSFGVNNDDLIEIYINKTSWESFSRAQRYLLMYHELGHDVLNLPDLDIDFVKPEEEQSIMFPGISSYDNYSMNDFIVNSSKLFYSQKEKEKEKEKEIVENSKSIKVGDFLIKFPPGFVKNEKGAYEFKNKTIKVSYKEEIISSKKAIEILKREDNDRPLLRMINEQGSKINYPISVHIKKGVMQATSLFTLNNYTYLLQVHIQAKSEDVNKEGVTRIFEESIALTKKILSYFN